MKKTLTLFLTFFLTGFLFSQHVFLNGSYNGQHSSSLINASNCFISSIHLTVSTALTDPVQPANTTYEWTWYRNNVQIHKVSSGTANAYTIPHSHLNQPGEYKVKLTINDYYVSWSNSLTVNLTGIISPYGADNISGRVVSGDFNRNGKKDNLAAFYRYSKFSTALHVWNGETDGYLSYEGNDGWWKSDDYEAGKLLHVVSGDFDRDGYEDDIAAIYDYGNFMTRIHVWTSNGNSFTFHGSAGWWYGGSYDATKLVAFVAGDFDHDGYVDDLMGFYDYGNFTTRAHVWLSTGSAFVSQGTSTGWWSSNQYDATKIAGRVVSGDFNKDGYKSDIIAFYDYGNFVTTAHMWLSNGSSLSMQGGTGGVWTSNNYSALKITNRLVSGDFNLDGFESEVVALYDYGSATTRAHRWLANGSNLSYSGPNGIWYSSQYDATKITDRIVSGDFNSNGSNSDISCFYDYGNLSVRNHVWLNNQFQGTSGWWEVCNPVLSKSVLSTSIEDVVIEGETTLFPNPVIGSLSIKSSKGMSSVFIFDNQGRLVAEFEPKSGAENDDVLLDLSHISSGLFMAVVTYDDGITESFKLVKE